LTTTDYLIEKHRGGAVLVDSNLLLLFFIGQFQRGLIANFKRLNTFAPEDYDTLATVLKQFGKIITTPNIITEVSNLSGVLQDKTKAAYYSSFALSLTLLDEKYVQSTEIARAPGFCMFGITDSAISLIAKRGILVMTDDLSLYQFMLGYGIDALNFNHVRSWYSS
jgi:hypothetical protein